MYLETAERLPIGEEVQIGIILTGTAPELSIDFNGRVCRITDYGIGFSFDKIDLDSYIHLKNIIAYNMDDSEKVTDEIHDSIDQKFASENADTRN